MSQPTLKLFSIFLLFFLLSPVPSQAFSNASAHDSSGARNSNIVSPHEYDIRYHASEPNEETPVLFLYSVPATEKESVSALKNILESHWNVSLTVRNFSDVSYADTEKYSHIILLELNADTEAIAFFSHIVENTKAKTVWIGFDDSSRFTKDNNIIGSEEIISIYYKKVIFEKDTYFKITGEISPEFTPLIYYTNTAKKTIPYVGILNNKDIRILSDLPASYDTSTYSLPFLDVFHNLFQHHSRNELGFPALLRLEDVNVHTYYSGRILNRVSKYLQTHEIPFQIAFIPRYINPEKGIDITPENSAKFTYVIKKMVAERNGVLVQHGYTHQMDDQISALGYEFWDAQNNKPIKFNSPREAGLYSLQKVNDAQKTMISAGLPVPDIWETPHYAQSKIDDEIFNRKYPLRYGHIASLGSLPFPVKIDGTIFIPENMGYITDAEQPKNKIEKIHQLLAFEDPVASVFWHPWRDQSELEEMIKILQDSGFTFVSIYDLVDNEYDPPTAMPVGFGIIFSDIILYFVFFSFIVGAIIYAHNVLLVRKYLKQMRNFTIPLSEVLDFSNNNSVPLPNLALFIPARNEGRVIGNTLRRIAKIDYPKDKLKVFVIVDERELDDEVERTTKDVARETATALHTEHNQDFIRIIQVPKWYSGVFSDKNKTFGKSTKGRALNFCLQTIDTAGIDMVGILDADGRLHTDVLKEVALKRMRDGSRLLQGPVFQVGNFKDVSIVGRAAGLELALHHLTELPSKLNKGNTLQFLAGTNYFIDTQCIIAAGGWDQTALVEDAEIALRLYTKFKIVGDWLNSPEIEQTPPNFAVYRKQRHRWVRGHIDLIKQIHDSALTTWEKIRLYNKIIFSQFRFLFDVGLPILSIYLMIAGAYSYIHPIFAYVSIVLFIASALIWDTYGFMYRSLKLYIDPDMHLKQQVTKSVVHLVFMPVFIIIQVIPRFTALFSYVFNRQQNTWYKTERTVEAIIH